MQQAPHVLIVRDNREARAKCSLTPLLGMDGIRFIAYRKDRRVRVGTRLLLHTAGPVLRRADLRLAQDGLVLIDCSWRRVPKLLRSIDGDLVVRRLPRLFSAYPRRSKTFEDPPEGLASVEALAAALAIVGHARPEILAAYHWRKSFLERNPHLDMESRAARRELSSLDHGDPWETA